MKPQFGFFAKPGSILDSQLSWESGKFQHARWSHRVALFSSLDHHIACATHPPTAKLFLPHLAPSSILSWAEKLTSFSLQDGATEWHYFLTWTIHPPTHSWAFCCAVSRLPVFVLSHPNYSPNKKSVCSFTFFCALFPHPNIILCLCNLCVWCPSIFCLGNLSTLILGLRWIINLAQLVYPSVALQAEHVSSKMFSSGPGLLSKEVRLDLSLSIYIFYDYLLEKG